MFRDSPTEARWMQAVLIMHCPSSQKVHCSPIQVMGDSKLTICLPLGLAITGDGAAAIGTGVTFDMNGQQFVGSLWSDILVRLRV